MHIEEALHSGESHGRRYLHMAFHLAENPLGWKAPKIVPNPMGLPIIGEIEDVSFFKMMPRRHLELSEERQAASLEFTARCYVFL